ncbi:sigma-70 family RNA polymerase sigma factor [Gordonia sp. HNM0687]|uniref:Sigma-70 family RNA polymerase sigma factor n=1 Tax=Gordonia mangrovi TaxID=2665643 RepID=A0A6L7GNC4_9ACTN|nr:sigma-70 family RNA polymerase sigma factor [Gordonia mangrovi]MXP21356.1 sigma-70 family RNA polymerase sigma factor [Gordonia mangrovi]UVF80106.1 sigma-70 family RNA polymerase sigma factor [Gordonia mangrovi]
MSVPLEAGGPGPADERLVAALRTGDMQALGAVYDRYGAALHTFAYSMVRSRERAADVTHDSFLVAVARIDQLRDPARLRPWLYAIVRSECLRMLRGAKRETVFTDWHDTADDDLPDADLHRQEIRELVRSALDGLSPKDREVVELSLRHDLDNTEIAAVLGVTPSHVTALTSRSRKALERSLGTLLVARAGGEGCDELTEMLRAWDGEFTPLWRKRIAKHVDNCATCTGERRRRFSPAAILVALPMLAAPIVLRERVVTDAEPVLAAYAHGAGDAHAASVPDAVDASGGQVASEAESTTMIAGQPAWDYPVAAPGGHRWWLWTTAAVTVLLAAGAIVAAVAVGTDEEVDPTPVVEVPTVEAVTPPRSATTVGPTSNPAGPVLPPPEVTSVPEGPSQSRTPSESSESVRPSVSSQPESGGRGEEPQPDPGAPDPDVPDPNVPEPAPDPDPAACPPLCGPTSGPAGPTLR